MIHRKNLRQKKFRVMGSKKVLAEGTFYREIILLDISSLMNFTIRSISKAFYFARDAKWILSRITVSTMRLSSAEVANFALIVVYLIAERTRQYADKSVEKAIKKKSKKG